MEKYHMIKTKCFKNIISYILLFNLIFTNCIFSFAAVDVPDKIRIGLYFEGTAVSGFTVSAGKGIEVGYYSGSNFMSIYSEPSGNALTIRKDAYFVNAGGKLTEYKPTDKTIPQGEKLGPYHIKVGTDYGDMNSANTAVSNLKSKGVAAFIVYAGIWQVWTGFYTDQSTAQAELISNIQPKVFGTALSVIQPASTGIVITTAAGDTAVIFGTDISNLIARPLKENNPYVFKLNGNDNLTYRGELEVRRFTGSDMTLINIVPSEQYLYGVVPPEIGPGSPVEALKAQAVAARTYMLNNLGKHGKWGFDLCTTTSCQVYKGYKGEYASTNKAVDETAGKKLTYNGKPAEVFYFASSGGRTEDVKNVWGSDIPYLKSVEDKYEPTTSAHYNWEKNLTAQKIYETMKGRGYDLGDIVSMTITKTSEAGRVTELVIKGTKDQRTYTREGCRTVFSLNSQMYTITSDADINVRSADDSVKKTQISGSKVMTSSGLKALPGGNSSTIKVMGADGQKKTIPAVPQNYVLTGKGWGHGVGMSQEGAIGMAKEGYNYEQILTHYFSGTAVE